MTSAWVKLTFFPLLWMRSAGLHPQARSVLVTIWNVVGLVLFIIIFMLAVTEVVVSLEDNIYFAIEGILTTFLYINILSKYLFLWCSKSSLQELLELRSEFWDLDSFHGNIKLECDNILKRCSRIIKGYLGYSVVLGSTYLVQPLFTNQLPVFVYVPNGWFDALVFTFVFLSTKILGSIFGTDTIFYSIAVPIHIQFKLLAYKFEHLDMKKIATSRDRVELNKLIDFHNFLIGYSSKINKTFSGIFVLQFLVAIAISCTQLFIASQPEFGILNKLKCLMYLIILSIQTAIYCFTTEQISGSCADVGNAIYKTLWYDIDDHNLRKDIGIVIVRSQTELVFSGFGMVSMNTQTFTQIFKTAMSFYTYLNTMVYND